MVVKEENKIAQRMHKETIIIDMLEATLPALEIGYFKTLLDAQVNAIVEGLFINR